MTRSRFLNTPFGLSLSKPSPHPARRPFDRLRANGSLGIGARPFDRLGANGSGLETHGHTEIRRLP